MTTLVLHPLDTLFFGDGRPYNQDDPSQADAASVFPPYPPTVVGAVRAALAQARGWPAKPWPAAELGDGVDWQTGDGPLGPLRFAGPYVLKDGEPLFPAPLCLTRARPQAADAIFGRLEPGGELTCDLGAVRLPRAPGAASVTGWKTLEGHWIDIEGMEAVLAGGVPSASSIRQAGDVFHFEPRVGIQRHERARTTARFAAADGQPERGALYAAAHVRCNGDVTLGMEVEGMPAIPLHDVLAPLGGESRSVWIETVAEPIPLPSPPKLEPDRDGTLRYTVVHATPADLGEAWPEPGGAMRGLGDAGLQGRVVGACLGRADRVGGWNGIERRPLPLRPLVPAGSVWFVEARGDEAETLTARHGDAVGHGTAWGFGRVLIGRWEPAGETT